MEEISEMAKWEGKELNEAKRRLAYEVTKLVHGEEEAKKAQEAADAIFRNGGVSDHMPGSVVADAVGRPLLDVLVQIKLIPSKGEGRRLIQQNGLSVNDKKITDTNAIISEEMFTDDGMIVKKGKKVFHKISLQ